MVSKRDRARVNAQIGKRALGFYEDMRRLVRMLRPFEPLTHDFLGSGKSIALLIQQDNTSVLVYGKRELTRIKDACAACLEEIENANQYARAEKKLEREKK